MPIVSYQYPNREFPHCGRNDLDCGDQVNPVLLNDQITSINSNIRLIPRRVISRFGMQIKGDIKLDFEIGTEPDYLVHLEFKMSPFSTSGGLRTGNLKAEFGIFSNPNARQVIGHWFVNQNDYLANGGLITFANPQSVGNNFQSVTISGQIDPTLQTFQPNREIVHGFLRLTLEYPGITLPGISTIVSRSSFNHPETQERFGFDGVLSVHIYTGFVQ